MRITSKGQVTIPQEIREKAGLLPGVEVEFIYDGKTVQLVRAEADRTLSRGEQAVRALSGSATRKFGMSTDELMKLLRGE